MKGWWIALVALAGCPKPIAAVPTSATITKGLVICWNDEEQKADDDDKPFYAAVRKELERAGYDLTSRVCDVTLGFKLGWQTDQGDKGYTNASLVVSDAHGVVDKFELHFDQITDVPYKEPDRLAILLVNEMNKSQKVAAVTRKNHAESDYWHGGGGACMASDPFVDAGCSSPKNRALIE